MSGANQFLPFANGTGATTLTYDQWVSLGALRASGFQVGVADEYQFNTLMRQLSTPTSGLAQLVADNQNQDVLDDGVPSNFESKLKAALQNIAAYVVQGGQSVFFAAGGTSTAYTGTLSPTPTNLTPDMEVLGSFTTPNTAASPTLNLNGFGALPVRKQNGQPAQIGDLANFVPLILSSDGSAWVINGLANSDLQRPVLPYTGGTPQANGFYAMDLGSQQIFTLPNSAGLTSGWYTDLLVTGTPSGYQTAYAQIASGAGPQSMMFRGVTHNPFYLIGGGEVLRFFWTGTFWIVMVLANPSISVNINMTNVGGATTLGGTGAYQYMAQNSATGSTPLISYSSTVVALSVPVSGTYRFGAKAAFNGTSSSYSNSGLLIADAISPTINYDDASASGNNVQAGFAKCVTTAFLKQSASVVGLVNAPSTANSLPNLGTFALALLSR